MVVALCPQLAAADGVLNLLVENDVISGNDRHYTSGVMLSYVSGLHDGPQRLRDWGIILPGLESGDQTHVAISLGHEIYTPTNIAEPQLIKDDRPYAGYAYLAAGFITENSSEIETWRVSLGLVGVGAGGERIQNALHRKIGTDEAQGMGPSAKK